MRFLKRLLLIAAVIGLIYGGYLVYGQIFTNYIETHPAGQEHRPDVFGR